MRQRSLSVLLLPVAVLVGACTAPAATPSTGAPSPAPTAPGASVAASEAPASSPTQSAEVVSGEVEIVMSDAMRYDPDQITVRAGEPITFLLRNEGVIVHEFFVGTEAEQAEHAEEMAQGGMGHGHDNALSLQPGASGSLTMTFAEPGTLLIGCHEPGHYEAGMLATLTVVD